MFQEKAQAILYNDYHINKSNHSPESTPSHEIPSTKWEFRKKGIWSLLVKNIPEECGSHRFSYSDFSTHNQTAQ